VRDRFPDGKPEGNNEGIVRDIQLRFSKEALVSFRYLALLSDETDVQMTMLSGKGSGLK
jgi:hypothetical protein